MCLWTNIFTAYSWHKCCMLVDTSERRRLNAFEILFIYFKRSRTILFRVEREGKRRKSDVKGDSIFLKTRRRERLKRERLTPLLFKGVLTEAPRVRRRFPLLFTLRWKTGISAGYPSRWKNGTTKTSIYTFFSRDLMKCFCDTLLGFRMKHIVFWI